MKLGSALKIAMGDNYVTNRYYEYAKNRNPQAEALHVAKLLTPDRDRRGGWSASAQGSCGRFQQFVYLGFGQQTLDDRLANIFANGDYTHLRHQAFGLTAGYIAAAEVPVFVPELKLKGSMDGLLDNKAVLEIKSIHTRGFQEVATFGPKPEHVNQVHSYMLATGTERAHMVYEDKNTQNIKELIVTRDDSLIEKIVNGLKDLNDATESKQLLPMLQECRNGEGKYRTCPFAPVCESAKWPRSKQLILGTSSSDRS